MNWNKISLALIVSSLAACGDSAPVDPPVVVVDAATKDVGPDITPTEDLGPDTIVTPDNPQVTDTTPTPDTTPTSDKAPTPDVGPMCTMPGESVCGGGCVDTMTSPLHCGMCDRACSSTDVCRGGTCVPSVTCMAGQTVCGGGCVDTMSDASHCGACNNACAAGQRCAAGSCAAVRMCPAGQTDCAPMASAMMCVDTQVNAMNCGSCGNACATGETCVMGVCQPPMCMAGQTRCTNMGVSTCVNAMTDNSNCGTCGTVCAAGEACMAGTCRSTCAAPRLICTVGGMPVCLDVQTDNANCGACGTACTSGQTCQMGRCACPMGRTACGTACVDTMSDAANCGRCANACGTGQTCTAGVCTCPRGQTLCGTTCVNTNTDIANCGRCTNRCTAPATCSAGVCNSLCGTGTTSCGGRCVALATFLTDNANCGSCGNACSTGLSCVTGVCRPTNDVRTNAITIFPNTTREVTVTGNTTASTYDGPMVPCGCTSGTGRGNVWYRFTIPAAGVVYLDTAGSMYDTSLFVTDSAGTAVPGQASSGFPGLGLCNDDSGCGMGGGFTSGLQSRSAGVLAAGTYFVAVGGCSFGTFTLRLQYVRSDVGRVFNNARISGTGNTGVVALMGAASSAAGTCGGSGGAENASWFLTCGATGQTQLFSVCRSDPGAFFLRRATTASPVSFDPVMYVRGAQNGLQVNCNDDGAGAGTGTIDCRGVIPFTLGANVGPLDTSQYGSRLPGLTTPRGIGVVFTDTLGVSNGMRYNMRFEAP
jgi:hypothetical protein